MVPWANGALVLCGTPMRSLGAGLLHLLHAVPMSTEATLDPQHVVFVAVEEAQSDLIPSLLPPHVDHIYAGPEYRLKPIEDHNYGR